MNVYWKGGSKTISILDTMILYIENPKLSTQNKLLHKSASL